MKRQHIPLYAAALGILFVGALAVGVPLSTLLFLALALACPAMMFFMHGGGHGGHGGHTSHSETRHNGDAGSIATQDVKRRSTQDTP